MSGELASERWSPAQSVESVLISILSLLDDAEVNSPANVDAGVMLRKQPEAYRERAARDVERSKEDIPAGFVMPTADSAFKQDMGAGKEDDFNWDDSDAEEDFGGSESEDEMEMYDEDDEDGPDGRSDEESDVEKRR